MSIRGIKLHRFDLRQGATLEREDVVAVDEAVCMFVNDEYFRTLIASPTMKRELVVGHLIGEGLIESVSDLKSIEIKPPKVYVELHGEVDLDLLSRSKVDLITTACGSLTAPLRDSQLENLKVASDIRVEAEKVWGMVNELNKRSKLFRETGGTHSAMLCSPGGEILAFAEDVGRHNAVDKVVGAAALSGVDMGGCVLICSGRQSSEMVLKATRAEVPVLASVAGPLDSGIRIAEAAGITLICFVRGRRMNVYTHPQRLYLNKETNGT